MIRHVQKNRPCTSWYIIPSRCHRPIKYYYCLLCSDHHSTVLYVVCVLCQPSKLRHIRNRLPAASSLASFPCASSYLAKEWTHLRLIVVKYFNGTVRRTDPLVLTSLCSPCLGLSLLIVYKYISVGFVARHWSSVAAGCDCAVSSHILPPCATGVIVECPLLPTANRQFFGDPAGIVQWCFRWKIPTIEQANHVHFKRCILFIGSNDSKASGQT